MYNEVWLGGLMMKKNLAKKTCALMALTTLVLSLTGCNSKIKVTNEYNPDDYVVLGEYKGIEASYDLTSIESSIIDKRVASDQKEKTTYSDVTRAAQDGDQVTVTFYGSVGGEQVSSFSNEDQDFVLGTDSFTIPGFLDALYGMAPGQTKVVTLTIPENFTQDETYSGRKIVYDVSMSAVKQPNVPMITDAYVKENFSCDTVADYKQQIKSELQSTIDEQVESAKKEAVLKQLQGICEIKGYPEDYLQQKSDDYNKSISFYSTMQGKSIDDYCQDTFGISFDEYVKRAVAQEMILRSIIVKENLSLTEYEYKGDLEQFAKDMGFTDKNSFVEKYGKDKIVSNMLLKKAENIVMDSAVFDVK